MKAHPLIIALCMAVILLIGGARAHPLWGDEAETALFAQNILKYGVPKGWDGTNIMGIDNAVVLNKNLINHTSPWAQYYLTAGSFLLFGVNAISARIPSIVLSIITLLLVYVLAIKLYGSKAIAGVSALLLSLTVQFILFGYQDRYYALITWCSVLLTFACLTLLRRSIWPKILFVVGGVLFFYGNYVCFVAFYLSLFITFLVYFIIRKQPVRTILRFIMWFGGLSLIMVFFTLPWYLAFAPFGDRGSFVFGNPLEFIRNLLEFFVESLYPYNYNNVFPVLFLVVFVAIVWIRLKKKQDVSALMLPMLLAVLYLFIMSVFTTVALVDTLFISTRYTMIVIPFFVLTLAFLVYEIWRYHRKIGLVVIVVLVTTNCFTFTSFKSYLWEYIGEILHPYITPDVAVAQYLKIHAARGDSAFVNFDRDHEPLIFLLGDKIRFVNRVSLVNTRIFPQNRGIIPRYIYDFRDEPDWVIMYSKRGLDGSFLTFDRRDLWPEVDLEADYREIVLPVFFSDMSRPEIELRRFSIPTVDPGDYIYIYEKKK
jgi:4-amino-4-deoxy-L-arabinose transferase-like glycosyltransferase